MSTNGKPLRLEYRTPAELADNPSNWRSHPKAQTEGLAAAVSEVGWAGALLFNETTGRLIDGHARKKLPASVMVDGKVPVLVGRWTEDQERLILATLDPLAAMAEASKDKLGELLKGLGEQSAGLQGMLDGLAEREGLTLPADADGREFDESCADDVEMTECPSCGHEFPK